MGGETANVAVAGVGDEAAKIALKVFYRMERRASSLFFFFCAPLSARYGTKNYCFCIKRSFQLLVYIHFELARLAAGIWDKFSMILDYLEIRFLSNATLERQK